MTADNAVPWKKITQAASTARKNAHAPYSNFKVGAAIWAGGRIFSGCNVENVSYPVGLCAERGAIGAAVAAGCVNFEGIVIVADEPITPCGMCRQALMEFAPKLSVLLVGQSSGKEVATTLDQLLPSPFVF